MRWLRWATAKVTRIVKWHPTKNRVAKSIPIGIATADVKWEGCTRRKIDCVITHNMLKIEMMMLCYVMLH